MKTLEISAATPQDLGTILSLQKACYQSEAELYDDFSIPPLTQDMASIAHDFEQQTILKGVYEDQLVASVRAFLKDGTCYVGRLMVKDGFNNKGFGKLMMQAVESAFVHCERFELFTGHKSLKNLYLYEKLGYKEFLRKEISPKLTMVYLEKRNLG